MNDEPLAWGGLPFTRKMMLPKTLRWFQAQGQVKEVIKGVFLDVRAQDIPQIRAAAVELVTPGDMIVCGRAAAWIHGIATTELDEPEVVNVTWRKHATDVVEIGDLRVISPAAAGVELALSLPPPFALSAVDTMLRTGMDIGTLRAALASYAGDERYRQADRVLRYADGRAASPGESWLRHRLLDAGFGGPDVQVRIESPDAVFRVDIGYPDHPVDGRRLALEYDSDQWHSESRQEARDERRREALEALGWKVIPVRRTDIWGKYPALELTVGGFFCQEPRLPRRW